MKILGELIRTNKSQKPKKTMNTQITINQLTELKLNGMAQAYQGILSLPILDQPTLHTAIAQITEAELQNRTHRKTQMFLKLSKLRYDALLEQIHCNVQRNFTKENLMALADCRFIDDAKNILITGATGCGKSYLACALGKQACALGYKTLYFGVARFIESIKQAKIEGTYNKLMNQLQKIDLLILDDFGLHPLDSGIRLAIFQILEDRYDRKSLIITSQLPVNRWYEYIDDPTLADAIMDRMAVNAHRIELKGESLRKKN